MGMTGNQAEVERRRMAKGKHVLTRDVMESVVPTLIREGHDKVAISQKLGCTISTLQVQCSNYGISLRNGHMMKKEALRVSLSKNAMSILARRAALRQVSEAVLASRLLELVISDGMIDAVLDDDEEE